MRSGTDAFRCVKRQVTDMLRHAKARFVERNFDPNLPQRVLWSNFRRLGLCDSSDFSSLGVIVEDFVDYCADVATPPIQVPTASDVVDNFFFVILILMSVSPRLRVSPPMPWVLTVFLLNF
jgi:hypothetical protein